MYLSKTPEIVKPLYSELVWSIDTRSKELFLTFDDGPTPGVTETTLDILAEFNAKATFFCVGYNIEQQPKIFARIKEEGHGIGNHTFDHTNGWKVNDETYLNTFSQCQHFTATNLFRPPYGRIRKSQVKLIKPTHHIIMWDVLAGDFDEKTRKERCLDNVLKNTKPGSIIVMHDSEKASEKMLYALPLFLKEFTDRGFEFKPIVLGSKSSTT